jgi:hypothetical protein
VEQNSTVYEERLDITSFPHNWDTLDFTGTFTSIVFTRLTGSGPDHPDFSGGVPTFFGFAASNFASGGPLVQDYDNFRLDSDALQILQSPPCTVPEPGSFLLVMVGVAYLGWTASGRQTRRNIVAAKSTRTGAVAFASHGHHPIACDCAAQRARRAAPWLLEQRPSSARKGLA